MQAEDGYILTMFRVGGDLFKGKPVLFLQHGFADSADCWVMNNGTKAPAFSFIEAGYDVWLGNSRGSKYSLGHNSLNHTKDKAYWEFSWPEMGRYDAPA